MIRIDKAICGVVSLEIVGRDFFRVQREFSNKLSYYGAFPGTKSKLWFFSYHNFNKVVSYLRSLNDEIICPQDFKEEIQEYVAKQKIIKDIKSGEPVDASLFPQNLNCQLRDYQLVGAAFLRLAERAILADEMGLGKTPMFLSAVTELIRTNNLQNIMLVCPTTLKYQWKEEIEKFLPKELHSTTIIKGNAKERKALYGSKLFTIAGYESIRADIEHVKTIPWDLVGLDEVQKIKTRGRYKTDSNTGERTAKGNKTSASIKELKPRFRFALGGTPIENSLMDMFSILEWIDPMLFGSIAVFKKRYMSIAPWGAQSANRQTDELSIKLSPVLLRREKKYVLPELPPFTENDLICELSGEQKRLYEDVQNEALRALNAIAAKQGRELTQSKFEIVAKLVYLREICDSPELIRPELTESCKLNELYDFLENASGKIIIFSQFERMGAIIEREIEKRYSKKYTVFRLHGGVPSEDRNTIRNIFNQIDKQIILVSTDCAKYGINLQSARWVINYDLPYNPATIDQRIGRAHRLGMEEVDRLGEDNNVSVLHITVRDSVEDRVKSIINRKRIIFDEIMTDDRILHKFSLSELRFILSGTV